MRTRGFILAGVAVIARETSMTMVFVDFRYIYVWQSPLLIGINRIKVFSSPPGLFLPVLFLHTGDREDNL